MCLLHTTGQLRHKSMLGYEGLNWKYVKIIIDLGMLIFIYKMVILFVDDKFEMTLNAYWCTLEEFLRKSNSHKFDK